MPIDFNVTGSTNLTLGGSTAGTAFHVSGQGEYLANETHKYVPVFSPNADSGWQLFRGSSDYAPDPTLTVDRTYANTGKTQTINFTVHDVDSSSIHLLGEGASDTFDIELGVGTFGNITVNDSDSSTEHPLTVGLHGSWLAPDGGEITDNSVQLRYFTLPTRDYTNFSFSTSVLYTPTVYYGPNIDASTSDDCPFRFSEE